MSQTDERSRTFWRWLRPRPKDAAWLAAARRHLEAKHKDSDLFPTPITSLRIFHPHPARFLAADGKTSFRYFKVLKNATSSILRQLAESQPAYRDGKDFLRSRHPNNQVDSVTWRGRSEYVVANGHRPGLYWFLPSNLFHPEPRADIRFCVVRDPVERFVSAWLNRMHRGSSAQNVKQALEQFVTDIENEKPARTRKAQRKTDTLAARDGHFHPHSYFLGEDPSYFTHIFNMRQLPALERLLGELSGQPIRLGRYNHSDLLEKPILDAALRQRIAALYDDDYRIFGRYF